MTVDKIRSTRLRAKLTQLEAAKLIGASMRIWQDWEGGRRNMPQAKWDLFKIRVSGHTERGGNE